MHIELRRTFRELLLKEQVDDARSLFPGHATLMLPELLNELRVVILSEGGTGKTEEIREAALRLRAEGKAAFFLRLEHVANDFDSAFEVGDLQEFQAWLASPYPGWLLLDSIDESRLRSPLDFAAAMRKVSARLSQAKQRTHLLVTGRTAAWRPKTDLDLCNGLFPVADERLARGHRPRRAWTTGPVRRHLCAACADRFCRRCQHRARRRITRGPVQGGQRGSCADRRSVQGGAVACLGSPAHPVPGHQ